MENLERIYKAFANRRRLAILRLLNQKKEMNVSDVASGIKLSFKATSKHLNILSNAGILDKDQRGLEMYYSLYKSPNRTILYLLKPISNSRE